MHDENIHINPDLNKDFPNPDIPVDEAWNQMKSMLDAGMPTSSSGGKMKGGGNNFWAAKLILVVAAGALTWGIMHVSDKSKIKNEDKPQVALENKITISDSNTISSLSSDLSRDSINNLQKSKAGTNDNTPKNIVPAKKTGNGSIIQTQLRSEPENTANSNPVRSKNKVNSETLSGITISSSKENADIGGINFPLIPNNQEEAGETSIVKSAENGSTNSTVNDSSGITTNKNDNINPASSSFAAKDSVGKEVKINNANKIHAGFQWNIALPFTGTDQYFTGFNGKSQPYSCLIPGIWVSRSFGKHEILLQLYPYQQNFTGDKMLSSIIIQDSLFQDSSIYRKTTNVCKTFGLGVGVQYNFEVNPSFIIGIGINYNNQNKALQKDKTEIQTSGILVSDSLYGIRKSSGDWNYLNHGFFSGKLEMAWRRKRFDAGANLQMPITNLSSSSAIIIKPVSGQVFFRWKIR